MERLSVATLKNSRGTSGRRSKSIAWWTPQEHPKGHPTSSDCPRLALGRGVSWWVFDVLASWGPRRWRAWKSSPQRTSSTMTPWTSRSLPTKASRRLAALRWTPLRVLNLWRVKLTTWSTSTYLHRPWYLYFLGFRRQLTEKIGTLKFQPCLKTHTKPW